ncbi:TonB-dependent receptor [Croceibacterium mercuriale]|uniref:TonB-dependent receptor n=1 Tax=Croceibacterium mercuriale TaxID=1572751 RepID=UPI0009DF9A72|nr:TonB-dependent receptor [Croceibacterium mercuriale]
MRKMQFCVAVSVLAIVAGGTQAHAQDVRVPPAGGGTSATGTPDPTGQVPVTTGEPDITDGAATDQIIVTGLRRSLESAAAIKRNSDAFVDAIVAEDIGKLPDTFASSALARVSGVSVLRGGGESAGVTVRGLPDISTTYNGREIFTAEGRFVQIQDFPAGTVAALEVFKSPTANLVEGGIGGQVNVRGRRPFDFDGFEMSGSLNGVDWDQSDKLSWNGNLLVSNRWDTGIGEIGVLVNASYVGINFLDATREQSLVIGTTSAANAPGTSGGVRFPDAQAMFLGYGDRFRPSANAAVQWKPTPDLEIYVDGLFQGYRGKDYNRFMFVPIFGEGTQLTNLTTREGDPTIAQSATVTGAFRPDGYYGSFNGKTDTFQFGGGAIWQRDALKLSADVAYTDSTYRQDGINIDYAFARSPVRNVVFEAGDDGGPVFDFVNFNVNDPANYISRGFFQENLAVSGKDIQARADAQYTFDGGFLQRIDFGVRFNDRDATRDRGAPYINNEAAGIPITALPVDFNSQPIGFDFGGGFPIRTFAGIPATSIRDNLPALRTFYGAPDGQPVFNPAENFTANEKAYAVYGQLKYGFDFGGDMLVDGVVGLRAVRTETSISGFQLDGALVTPITAENDYTDYLPNVSARVAFTDELQLRLAYTQTRTRPNFFDLNPTLTVGPPVVNPNPNDPNSAARGITSGNPDLTPLTSNNYDISLEWYFSPSGSLTGALFRRDAQGFISRAITFENDPVYGLVRIDRPENTGDTRFQGAEVAFTSFLDLDSLPEWARGFGVQANGTYIDSAGDLAVALGGSPNVTGEQVRFNGVSKWTYNLVALYERPIFSARLAYNYRSNFVTFYSIEPLDVGTDGSPRTRGLREQGRGQLDFSTTVTPIPNITVAFDVVNVLGNPLQRYRDFNDNGDEFARQILYLERTYSLGVRFRF